MVCVRVPPPDATGISAPSGEREFCWPPLSGNFGRRRRRDDGVDFVQTAAGTIVAIAAGTLLRERPRLRRQHRAGDGRSRSADRNSRAHVQLTGRDGSAAPNWHMVIETNMAARAVSCASGVSRSRCASRFEAMQTGPAALMGRRLAARCRAGRAARTIRRPPDARGDKARRRLARNEPGLRCIVGASTPASRRLGERQVDAARYRSEMVEAGDEEVPTRDRRPWVGLRPNRPQKDDGRAADVRVGAERVEASRSPPLARRCR